MKPITQSHSPNISVTSGKHAPMGSFRRRSLYYINSLHAPFSSPRLLLLLLTALLSVTYTSALTHPCSPGCYIYGMGVE